MAVAAVIGKIVAGLSAGAVYDRLTVALGMIPRGEEALLFASMGDQFRRIEWGTVLGYCHHGDVNNSPARTIRAQMGDPSTTVTISAETSEV